MDSKVQEIVLEIEARVKKCQVRLEKAKERADEGSVREERAVASDLKDLRSWIINQNPK